MDKQEKRFPSETPVAGISEVSGKTPVMVAVEQGIKQLPLERFKDYVELTGIELEPIASGALLTPLAGQTRTMDIVGPPADVNGNPQTSTWTHATLPGGKAELTTGKKGKLFFSNGVWRLTNVQDLPKVPVKNEAGESEVDAASQKLVTDVKRIADFNNEYISGVKIEKNSAGSGGTLRTINIEADFLKNNNAIKWKISGANSTSLSDIYLFREDETYIIATYSIKGDSEGVIFLEENFKYVRCFNNASLPYTFSIELVNLSERVALPEKEVKSLSSKNKLLENIFWSSEKVSKVINWSNSTKYWTGSGSLITNVDFDISNPIPTNNFKYFGYIGRLNKGNTAIVAVDVNNNYLYTVQVGELEYNKNGDSLFIFKTNAEYISLSVQNIYKSVSELFELKSPWLIGLLDKIEFNKLSIEKVESDYKNAISNLEKSISESVVYEKSVTGTKLLEIPSELLKKGRTITNQVFPVTPTTNISVFLFRADGSYILAEPSAPLTAKRYKLQEDFVKIRYYNNDNLDGFRAVSTVLPILSEESKTLIRALFLGDSYSQTNGSSLSPWVRSFLEYLPSGSEVKSLAVSSATIRDKYADRSAYPYTSRPVQSNSTGNLNTLACQIEKLERLMTGTDLDPGEVQWYADVKNHPNVIIIEGAMNDSVDTDESKYSLQFTKEVTAYNKRSSDSNPVNGKVWIKTPLEEVDRTTFAGAYRYAVERLLNIFPNAQIYIITASRLGYWTYDINSRRSTQARQQRICAELCGAHVIDWAAYGQINTIVNYPVGSGTQEDPYVWDRTVGNVDTNDAMHPNTRGGKKYGRIAAKVVMNTFINLMDE